MVLKDGRLVMPYGTPGNDVQPQAMVQFLVNLIDYGMNPQQAMDAPRCATFSFPRSSDPHPYTPGLAHLERRVDPSVSGGPAEDGARSADVAGVDQGGRFAGRRPGRSGARRAAWCR